MQTIFVRNVHSALPEGIRLLKEVGIERPSRNGPVIVSPSPVMTVYSNPWEKVLFWSDRDANPFFHLMESIWMLAGQRDVEWLTQFNSRMKTFSDDGKTLNGAYGWRWRHQFGFDQLDSICKLLTKAPSSRRAVLAMWDASADLIAFEEGSSKDLPCNTHIYLGIVNGALDLTVMCRSNDAIWGAYGTNSVHFAILQEYLAAQLCVKVGSLYQFSNNFHAYLDVFNKVERLSDCAKDPYRTSSLDPYKRKEVYSISLTPADTLNMAEDFVAGKNIVTTTFYDVAILISAAWNCRKNYDLAYRTLERIPYDRLGRELDWKRACVEWLQRRELKKTSFQESRNG